MEKIKCVAFGKNGKQCDNISHAKYVHCSFHVQLASTSCKRYKRQSYKVNKLRREVNLSTSKAEDILKLRANLEKEILLRVQHRKKFFCTDLHDEGHSFFIKRRRELIEKCDKRLEAKFKKEEQTLECPQHPGEEKEQTQSASEVAEETSEKGQKRKHITNKKKNTNTKKKVKTEDKKDKLLIQLMENEEIQTKKRNEKKRRQLGMIREYIKEFAKKRGNGLDPSEFFIINDCFVPRKYVISTPKKGQTNIHLNCSVEFVKIRTNYLTIFINLLDCMSWMGSNFDKIETYKGRKGCALLYRIGKMTEMNCEQLDKILNFIMDREELSDVQNYFDLIFRIVDKLKMSENCIYLDPVLRGILCVPKECLKDYVSELEMCWSLYWTGLLKMEEVDEKTREISLRYKM